jgi:demethylmenaquinone methyltransferase/2-methoxy-6-polyprenyl-1,4-benzoquinol methylase
MKDGLSKAKFIHRMFTDLSENYDVASKSIALSKDGLWRDFAASFVDGCGDKVLDVACGTGELSIRLRKKCSGTVFAFDFCQGMVREAKTKYGNSSVNFGVADAQKLPFPDETFTCVTIGFALRNVSDIPRTISEMMRVVKKGGVIIVLDLGKPREALFRKPYYLYFYHIAPKIGGFLAKRGNYAYEYLPQSLTNFPAQDGIKDIMGEIGLSDIHVFELTKGIAAVHIGTKAG